jgi:hypothetical protein
LGRKVNRVLGIAAQRGRKREKDREEEVTEKRKRV